MDVKSGSCSTQILHPQRYFPSRQLRSSSPGEEAALTAYCSAEFHILFALKSPSISAWWHLHVSSALPLKHFSLLDSTKNCKSNYLHVLKQKKREFNFHSAKAFIRLHVNFAASSAQIFSFVFQIFHFRQLNLNTLVSNSLQKHTDPLTQLIISFLLFHFTLKYKHQSLSRNQQHWKNKQPFKSGSRLLLLSFRELNLLSPL